MNPAQNRPTAAFVSHANQTRRPNLRRIMARVRARLVREASHDGRLNLVDPVRDFRIDFTHFLVERLVVGPKRLSAFIFTHGVVSDCFQFADSLNLNRLFLGSVKTLLLCGIVLDGFDGLFRHRFGSGLSFPRLGLLLSRRTLDRLLRFFGFRRNLLRRRRRRRGCCRKRSGLGF